MTLTDNSGAHWRLQRCQDLQQDLGGLYILKPCCAIQSLLSPPVPLRQSHLAQYLKDIQLLYESSLGLADFRPIPARLQKVEKKDIFLDKVHRFLDKQTFTFPNVKNGSILEYTYEIVSPFIRQTEAWYFQQSIPVVTSNLTFQNQEYFNYQQDLRGGFAPKLTKNTKKETYNVSSNGSVGKSFKIR